MYIDKTFNYCLLGYSGHGFVVAEALLMLGFQALEYADQIQHPLNPFNLPYSGFEKDVNFSWGKFKGFALGVGDNKIRASIMETGKVKNIDFLTVVHPQALVAKGVAIGKGTFIARGACINSLAKIGAGVIVNTGAVIEHECIIENLAHVAPGAVLTGNVKIGKSAFIGANAVIRQGVKIGNNSIIGAGAVVLDNVPERATVVGNPARVLSYE